MLAVFKPDVLQTDVSDLGELQLPAQLELLPVLRSTAHAVFPARVLFEGPASGTGVTCDWTEAQRVARALRDLPVIRGEFAAARLSYAKVRALTRIATPDTDRGLARSPGR